MKPTVRVMIPSCVVGLVFLLAAVLAWAQRFSHVRIVRLSFVEGTVAVQRPDVADWARALVNTPIQEGYKVSTGENGFAEIEFENTSTARLGQLSLLEFNQLALMPSGGKMNRLTLHQGYATFSLTPEGDDLYQVLAAGATLKVPAATRTRFRADLDEGLLLVKVFDGSVEVSSSYGSGVLARNTVLELRPGAEQAFKLTRGITKDAWDEWVEQREDQAQMARNKSGPLHYTNDVTELLYGWNDLSLYGNWTYFPAHGFGWAPNVPYGWTPYSNGRWCFYPGFGYTWISGEPWGWLPYHYGEWSFQPGVGWCWIPGSFQSWSPALVTWYQGRGWIGWTPGSGNLAGRGRDNCPLAQPCGPVVDVDTFQNGRPVSPNRLPGINPLEGRLVANPDISPSRAAMLLGSPIPEVELLRGAKHVAGFSESSVVSSGRAEVGVGGAPPTSSVPSNTPTGNTVTEQREGPSQPGIVFDSQNQRFENNPNTPTAPGTIVSSETPSPQSGSIPRGGPSATVLPTSTQGTRGLEFPGSRARPAPQGNPDAPLFGAPGTGRTGRGEAPASPGISSRPAHSRPDSSGTGRPSYSPPPSRPAGSAPSASPRFDSGSSSRSSSGPSFGSSGGGRSGGGGVVGGSSGGSVGGSQSSGASSPRAPQR